MNLILKATPSPQNFGTSICTRGQLYNWQECDETIHYNSKKYKPMMLRVNICISDQIDSVRRGPIVSIRMSNKRGRGHWSSVKTTIIVGIIAIKIKNVLAL